MWPFNSVMQDSPYTISCLCQTQSPNNIFAQVLQWMVDAGIRPSSQMYLDISSFAHKSAGAEYATLIKERIGMHMNISFYRILLSWRLYFVYAS